MLSCSFCFFNPKLFECSSIESFIGSDKFNQISFHGCVFLTSDFYSVEENHPSAVPLAHSFLQERFFSDPHVNMFFPENLSDILSLDAARSFYEITSNSLGKTVLVVKKDYPSYWKEFKEAWSHSRLHEFYTKVVSKDEERL